MSSLKVFSTLLLDLAMSDKKFDADDPITPSAYFRITFGNGRAVKAYLSDAYPDTMHISFERKLLTKGL